MVRVKHRYLLIELVWSKHRYIDGLSAFDFYKIVRALVEKHFGVVAAGACSVSLQVKYINMAANTVILRCLSEYHRIVWAALTLCTNIAGVNVFLRVLHVGGTIRGCQRTLIDMDQKLIAAELAQIEQAGDNEEDEAKAAIDD